MISLKVYDDTAAIRLLLYSNKFLDLNLEIIEQLNFMIPNKLNPNKLVSAEEAHNFKNINRII